MASIPVGQKGEHRRRVTSDIAIDFMGLEARACWERRG
jgi:hypothetical protein